ncbi:hypothetical protein FHX96_001651 [Clostridium tetanomorphum]|nr:hypothetical protein [Clostridium tetanomorphum]
MIIEIKDTKLQDAETIRCCISRYEKRWLSKYLFVGIKRK